VRNPADPHTGGMFQRATIMRFGRYIVASVVASAVSATVFAVVYRWLDAGPRWASVISFVAGAVVNFMVFRYWTWRSRLAEDIPVRRELLSYSVVAVTTALIALGTTSVADHYARAAHVSADARTLIVEGAYFGAFGLMFVVKFLVLDRLVFTQRDALRSRHQVEKTTRA
jgi:putative flippase GtrA